MEIDDVELPESNVKFEEEDMVVDLMVNKVKSDNLDTRKNCNYRAVSVKHHSLQHGFWI